MVDSPMKNINQQLLAKQKQVEPGPPLLETNIEFDIDSPDRSAAQARLINMSVLLVEDNSANQIITKELLESEGARVTLAENGEEALELFKYVENPFDIVLMDIQMPVMNGYQASREIRKTLGFNQLPIVAMSANALQSDCKAAFAAGMNAYIEKPFDLEFLVKKLIQLCHWKPLTSDGPTVLSNLQDNNAQNKMDGKELLNVDASLARFNGKKAVYHRALRIFIQDSQRAIASLPELLDDFNHVNMLSSLHSIKGMAANFGADAVAELCKQFEIDLAIDKGEEINQASYRLDLEQLQSTLLATCQLIQQKLTVSANMSKNELSSQQTRDLPASLLQLAKLLAQSDLEALSLHQRLFDEFSAVKPDFFQSLDNSVNRLEFAEAEKICYSICASLENNQERSVQGGGTDPASNVATSKGRILVVDDQASNIYLIRQLFCAEYQVFMATCGQQAVDFCAKTPPDLILLDVAMPGMNGMEVCRILKQDHSTATIPIIFLTALDSSDAENNCWDCGADDFVSKPVNPRTLQNRVNAHLALKFQTDLLRQQAFIDGLTGIANRRYFDEYLAKEWNGCGRSNLPLSLAILDIDHFKLYNDHYGHQQGDLCLQAITTAIATHVKREGDLFARYGGEEFCILLPRTPLKDSINVIQSIEGVVRELKIPHQAAIGSDIVTVSIGLASLVPQLKQSASELIKLADKKMYCAKDQGRGRVAY